VLVWRFQDRLAFPSPRAVLPVPADVRVRAGKRITVRTSDGVDLSGWYLAPTTIEPGGKSPGVVWFYGNMETVSALAPILDDFHNPRTGVVILDYRGYGENPGSLTEDGLYRDADAAWDYLATRAEIDSTRIVVYGRSLGSVAALYLATTKPVRAVILDSPFTNIREMAALHYAFIPRFLVRLSMDNLERAGRLAVPLLVFHGTKDWIAPVGMGEKVAKAGRGDLIRFEGAGHNDTYDVGGEEYRDRMWAFLDRALAPR
jgi:hypothetical protein